MLLQEKGHTVYPVHQRVTEINGIPVYPTVRDIPGFVDTISVYVNADISSAISTDILAKAPTRIIFNPGTENPKLQEQAKAKGITVMNACTLVMLKTGQF